MELYCMNTKTTVSVEDPSSNKFGHTLDGGSTFVYLRSTQSKNAIKIWSTYGGADEFEIGQRVHCIQDTGLGHRSMPDHIVVAVLSTAGLKGELPNRRKLPYWVAK